MCGKQGVHTLGITDW